jgi:hypothetical protein
LVYYGELHQDALHEYNALSVMVKMSVILISLCKYITAMRRIYPRSMENIKTKDSERPDILSGARISFISWTSSRFTVQKNKASVS